MVGSKVQTNSTSLSATGKVETSIASSATNARRKRRRLGNRRRLSYSGDSRIRVLTGESPRRVRNNDPVPILSMRLSYHGK